MSRSPAVRDRFLELRAQGYTLERIAKELDVSKRCLVHWNRQLKDRIDNLRAMHLESLQDTYFVAKEKRIQLFGRNLHVLLQELESRHLTHISDAKLFELILKYGQALKREELPITFQPDDPPPAEALIEPSSDPPITPASAA